MYDGTSWTTSPTSLNTARYEIAGAGTQSAALAAGGYTTTQVASTEEWTGPGAPLVETITAS